MFKTVLKPLKKQFLKTLLIKKKFYIEALHRIQNSKLVLLF